MTDAKLKQILDYTKSVCKSTNIKLLFTVSYSSYYKLKHAQQHKIDKTCNLGLSPNFFFNIKQIQGNKLTSVLPEITRKPLNLEEIVVN